MQSFIESMSGVTNGTNLVFTTRLMYRSGTLNLFVNGMLQLADGDASYNFVEVSPKTIRLNIAPRAGDLVAAFYVPL